MKFQITDNLPDLSDRIYAEEVHILLSVASSLSPALTSGIREEATSPDEEVDDRASRAVCSREHATTG